MTSFKSVLVSLFLATSALAGAPANAVETVITFDAGDPIGGLGVGAVLDSQYAGYGVTFASNAFTGSGGPTGNWATNTTMSVVSSSGTDVGGLGNPSLVSGNMLRAFNGWLNENGDPSFSAFLVAASIPSAPTLLACLPLRMCAFLLTRAAPCWAPWSGRPLASSTWRLPAASCSTASSLSRVASVIGSVSITSHSTGQRRLTFPNRQRWQSWRSV